ncbi:MAG: FAD:protein FMN transferase [Nocardioidaceae bacterium]
MADQPVSTLDHREFRALGTYVHLATSDPADLDRAAALAEDLLALVDATCSRFRRDSDLSRVNAGAGRWVRADPLLLAAVRVALDAAHETDGLVDPCLGAQLVSLRYDADLRVVRLRQDPPVVHRRPHPVDAWREVALDSDAIRVPAGVALDLGATAKAWAADLIALAVVDELDVGVVVSLGGDVRAIADERVPEWPVVVTEHPEGTDATTVWVDGGGLATSSTQVRRWRAGGVERHHLLDPRTGLPVDGPWRTVTATGPTSVAANVATTAALVLGNGAVPWLGEHRVDARLVGRDGVVTCTGSWPVERAA